MVKAKKKLSLAEKKEAAQGYLFVTPYLIAFTIFTGIPFVSAFVLSFMNVKFITKFDSAKFVGLKNFIRFFSSKEAMAALGRSAIYTLIYVPVIMVLSFVLTYLLNKGVFWAKGIRSMFFLPYISNIVAVSVVFQLLLGPRGPFYLLQKFFGSENPLLLNQKWARPAVVLIAVWKRRFLCLHRPGDPCIVSQGWRTACTMQCRGKDLYGNTGAGLQNGTCPGGRERPDRGRFPADRR